MTGPLTPKLQPFSFAEVNGQPANPYGAIRPPILTFMALGLDNGLKSCPSSADLLRQMRSQRSVLQTFWRHIAAHLENSATLLPSPAIHLPLDQRWMSCKTLPAHILDSLRLFAKRLACHGSCQSYRIGRPTVPHTPPILLVHSHDRF